MDSKKFRKESATVLRSYDLKNTPTYDYQESCHKVPNSILSNAFNNTLSQNVRVDLLAFGFSSGNIFYSGNNKSHSKQENDLKRDNFHQFSINNKGGQIITGLLNLHNMQSSSATTHVLRTMMNSGLGYAQIVANLDKRQFTNPSERQQIDIARGMINGDYYYYYYY
ncbi:hypothetical protein DLAC_04569 [Tieghemostelium lacteum]|uniref:Uncharacterized protein n=1 Tax=Tieghemostelium lacteum TaxID=361077 RepID=A0A151ZK61_TIELA|nr:hypothetical protein DLAC_04569 [Tieghemostelium lacteum]|eukprot:KYQ94270.1 hypothetical protein DLAC_04569 [Tieghemostelium lacteum]